MRWKRTFGDNKLYHSLNKNILLIDLKPGSLLNGNDIVC